MPTDPPYHWLLDDAVLARARRLLDALRSGEAQPGGRLAAELEGGLPSSAEALVAALLRTKQTCIFAESEIRGDGSDWTSEEVGLMGDISCLVPVTVFDDGRWDRPRVHEPPFSAHLLFVPSALMHDHQAAPAADRLEVAPQGRLDAAAYGRLYARRLRPVFDAIEAVARAAGKGAVVTLPGLGCGAFAGAFRGQLGALLAECLHEFLASQAERWPSLRLVHFDPHHGLEAASWRIGDDLVYRIRPLCGAGGHPQLSRVEVLDEDAGRLSGCHLFSLVAWDHVSWPGNDFYGGSRNTDDGVKAAATDSMYRMTGVRGQYDPHRYQYRPPQGYGTWGELVRHRGIRLRT